MTTLSTTGTNSYDPVSAYGNYVSAGAVRADALYSKTSDIVIQTREGDKVTLSSSTYTAGSYESYESLAVGRGAAVYQYGEAAYVESSQQLNLSVTGDLSPEELRDINKILGTLDKMMKDLTAGDLESALARSARFARIDSIASFSADMSVTASIAVSSYEAVAASIPQPPAEGREDGALGRIDKTADDVSSALNAKSVVRRGLVSKLDDYFSDWFEERQTNARHHGKGMKWASRFARRLMEGLKSGGAEETESGRAKTQRSATV